MMNNMIIKHNSYPMHINRLLLMVTRDNYQDVYHRVYNINATDTNTIEKLANLTDINQPSPIIQEGSLANNLPNIISINPKTFQQVQIPNGWRTQRLRFLLEVEYEGPTSQTTFIQGFSEYYDPTYNGNIDGNMEFYINSITTISKIFNPITGTYDIKPVEIYNVLTDRINNSVMDNYESKLSTLRPKDLIGNLYLENEYFTNESSAIKNLTDKISATRVQTSNRTNNNMYSYLSKSINAYTNAKMQANMSHGPNDILKNASSMCYEMEYGNNVFVRALCNLTGEYSPTKFTLNQIELLFPGFGNSNNITLINRNEFTTVSHLRSMLDADNTAPTLQPTYENSKAIMLANIIPSVTLDCLLTKIDFSITNSNGPEPIVIVSSCNSFILSGDLTKYINMFISKIITLVMPQLTDSNQSLVEAYVSCDVIGDITIGLSINNQPELIYRFPVFADSLYTPMIGDQQSSHILKNDLGGIFDELVPGNVASGLINTYSNYI